MCLDFSFLEFHVKLIVLGLRVIFSLSVVFEESDLFVWCGMRGNGSFYSCEQFL